MKAAFYTGNKSFSVEQVEAKAPNAGEVQVAVAYVGICGTDMHVCHGAIDCDRMISDVRALEEIGQAFKALDGNATAMKSLIKVS